MSMTYGGRLTAADSAEGRPRIQILPQILIITAAVAAYFLVRGLTESAYPQALVNADRVVRFEQWIGIYHEPALQDAVVNSSAITRVINMVYIWGHWPVIALTLFWLARQHPTVFLRTRNAMLISGGIGLVVFATFPVAPPRLAELGMTDTVTTASEAYRVLQPTIFTNQYAAMPSLHVGWNLLMALAIISATWHLPTKQAITGKITAVVMATGMSIAVVLTANHYLIDAVIGAALTSGCWLAIGRRPADHNSQNMDTV